MNRSLRTLRELLAPGSVRHSSLPPMEAGLRPNSDLDHAEVLVKDDVMEPEDVLFGHDGRVRFSAGHRILRLDETGPVVEAELPGPVGALERSGTDVLALVAGVGIVLVAADGSQRTVCDDEAIQRCATDLTLLPDGSILVTVGSTRFAVDQWTDALVHRDRSGQVVHVVDGRADVRLSNLAWPAGIAAGAHDDVLLALAFDHTIQRRRLADITKTGDVLRENLPAYPGRIRRGTSGWWVSAPMARNRMSEMVLDEPQLLEDLTTSLDRKDWPMPRLRSETPYTDVLQMGQLRMLGVLKPWAPPRSYGLVFEIDEQGRVMRSHHSRVDGSRHGVTGADERDGRLVLAGNGCRAVLAVKEGK
jgi:hypothetical protein